MTFDEFCFAFSSFMAMFWLYILYCIFLFVILECVFYVMGLIIKHRKHKKIKGDKNNE